MIRCYDPPLRFYLFVAAIACGIAFIACGSVEAIKPPNTVSICDRALVCGAIVDVDACVACLEHIDPEALAELRQVDIPPLDTVSCDTIATVVELTNLGQCIDSRWYGPFDFAWGPS